MSVWQKIWRSNSNNNGANNLDEEKIAVDVLEDDQPHNPFTELLPLHHHTDIVRQLLLIDDRRCVSVGDDCLAVLWDIQLCCKLFVLSGHSRPITCMLLLDTKDNTNDWLLTGSSDKQIRLWDLDQGKCIQVITEHNSSVRCLMSLQQKNMFISGGQGLHLWSADGKLLSSFDRSREEADISLMVYTKNERLVVASNKELRVFTVTDMDEKHESEVKGKITLAKKLPSHREAVREMVIVNDIIFATGSLDGTIILWSTQSYLPTYTFNIMAEYKGKDQRYPYSIQHMICVEERYIMAAVGSGFALFDIMSRRLICKKVNAHYSKVLHLTFVCDGTFLATCSEDGSIRLWGQGQTGNMTLGERADMAHGVIERFMGRSLDESKSVVPGGLPVFEPMLLGDCVAHSGAVESVIECGGDAMLSCGVDGLVIAWKNSELQTLKRNQLIQEKVLNPSGIV